MLIYTGYEQTFLHNRSSHPHPLNGFITQCVFLQIKNQTFDLQSLILIHLVSTTQKDAEFTFQPQQNRKNFVSYSIYSLFTKE